MTIRCEQVHRLDFCGGHLNFELLWQMRNTKLKILTYGYVDILWTYQGASIKILIC